MNITKRQFVAMSLFLGTALSVIYLAGLNESSNDSQPPYFGYVVQQGDTCLDIAYNLGVSVESIVQSNNLIFDCSDIYVGQKLHIPYPTPTPSGFIETTQIIVECEKISYVVQDGDDVLSIASDYYVPKDAIRFFNGLDSDNLTPGAKIIVSLCVRTPRYIDPTPTATLFAP